MYRLISLWEVFPLGVLNVLVWLAWLASVITGGFPFCTEAFTVFVNRSKVSTWFLTWGIQVDMVVCWGSQAFQFLSPPCVILDKRFPLLYL